MLCRLNLLNHYGMLHRSTLFTDGLNIALKKSNCNAVTHPTIYSGIYGLKNKPIRLFTNTWKKEMYDNTNVNLSKVEYWNK